MKRSMFVLLLVFFHFAFCHGLRIPLEGMRAGGGESSSRIGIVDMEMIFNEFPETRRGQKIIEKEIIHAKKKLDEMKLEIESLQKEYDEMQKIENTTGALPGMDLQAGATGQFGVIVSTAPGEAQSAEKKDKKKKKKQDDKDSKNFKKMLKEKEDLLKVRTEEREAYRKESEINLLAMEKRKSREILGRLFGILDVIAQEEKIDIILDKNYVLYGKPVVDLTDKLRRRLAGEQ